MTEREPQLKDLIEQGFKLVENGPKNLAFGELNVSMGIVEWPCVIGNVALSVALEEKKPLVVGGEETYATYKSNYLLGESESFQDLGVFPAKSRIRRLKRVALYLSNSHTEMERWSIITKDSYHLGILSSIINSDGS